MRTFHISDRLTGKYKSYIKAENAAQAMQIFFDAFGIREDPVRPKDQLSKGIKSRYDARFYGHCGESGRSLAFNRNGYAFDICCKEEYKIESA